MIEFINAEILHPEDPDRFVQVSDPDGVYLRKNDAPTTGYQIIVVGPMPHTPVEYARALSVKLGMTLRVTKCLMMAPGGLNDELSQIVLDRGFHSILVDEDARQLSRH